MFSLALFYSVSPKKIRFGQKHVIGTHCIGHFLKSIYQRNGRLVIYVYQTVSLLIKLVHAKQLQWGEKRKFA